MGLKRAIITPHQLQLIWQRSIVVQAKSAMRAAHACRDKRAKPRLLTVCAVALAGLSIEQEVGITHLLASAFLTGKGNAGRIDKRHTP